MVPPDFQMTPDLERSVLDLGSFRVPRRLPLIADILDRLYEAAEAEYLIYTNVDIALMPHFYLVVDRFIEMGYDAFAINRRTVSQAHTRLEDIPLMAAQVGESHRGHDCFVFRKDAYPHYCLGTACIGAARVGAVLGLNLAYHSERFQEFTDLHLTFHIGNEKVHRSPQLRDYFAHNEREAKKVLQHYDLSHQARDVPFIEELARRYNLRASHQERPELWRRAIARLKRWLGRLKA
jgi:hypothetical protein